MATLLQELPKPDQIKRLLDGQFTPELFGLSFLDGLDFTKPGNEIVGSFSQNPFGNLALPQNVDVPSQAAFLKSLTGSLDQLKGIDATKLVAGVDKSAATLGKPDFALNTVFQPLASQFLAIGTSVPALALPMPTVTQTILQPIFQLTQLKDNTPQGLLQKIIEAVTRLINSLKDPSQLTPFATTFTQELWTSTLQTVTCQMPLAAVGQIQTLFTQSGGQTQFFQHYTALLDNVAKLAQNASAAQKQPLIDTARRQIAPELHKIRQTQATLSRLAKNDVTQLTKSLEQLAASKPPSNLTGGVVLQPLYQTMETGIGGVLTGVATPLDNLVDLAEKIQSYLNQSIQKAEEVAKQASGQIEKGVHAATDLLKKAQTTIQELEKQISAFVQKLDVQAIVDKIKSGCDTVSTTIQKFFGQVEALKQKLETSVARVGKQVDEKVTAAFTTLEKNIRELLSKITAILERPEVKDALEQVRKGMERFKKAIDEASLRAIFDAAVKETQQLDGEIKKINVAKLNTPTKLALQTGTKVIREVKVDEALKPELMAIFEEIREPLKQLIEVLKKKVEEIQKVIQAFKPGTLATKSILESEPYQAVIKKLESFKPSQLLAPLKQANTKLTGLIKQLDPQTLMNQLQGFYKKLEDVVKSLAPEPLVKKLNEAVGLAEREIKKIRDLELKKILDEIQKSVSLQRLLTGSGVETIVQGSFWQQLHSVLDGAYLTEIDKAMTDVEGKLATVKLGPVMSKMSALANQIKREVGATGTEFQNQIKVVDGLFKTHASTLKTLDERRKKLLTQHQADPILKQLLTELDLAPVLALQTTVAQTAALSTKQVNSAYAAVKSVLQVGPATQLASLKEADLQKAIPALFKNQIGDPVRQIVKNLQTKMKPLDKAAQATQQIAKTVTELPGRINQIMTQLRTTLQTSITKVIDETLVRISQLQTAIVKLLRTVHQRVSGIATQFSPAWLLNSFATGDFVNPDKATVPKGLINVAQRIAQPQNDAVATLLQQQLTSDKVTALQKEASTGKLSAANQQTVREAFNALLRKDTLAAKQVPPLKQSLEKQINTLQKEIEAANKAAQAKAKPAATSATSPMGQKILRLYRLKALQTLLPKAYTRHTANKKDLSATIRLNRILLEIAYPDALDLSPQTLYAVLIELVANLYPTKKVKQLDDTYTGTLNKVKKLPDQMIRKPLDDDYTKIQKSIQTHFNIGAIFQAVEKQVDEVDKDLSKGLDQLSGAFNQLLVTLDDRLKA